MEETKNLTPAIDALSLAVQQYIDGIDIASLSEDQTPVFSMLSTHLSILKNPLVHGVEFVEFCAKLISVATDLDKRLKSSLVDNIRKILVDNAPEEFFRVRMLRAFDIYESKQHRKLNDDSIALAKQMIKFNGASDLYDELYKFIKTFQISNEEEGLLKILYKVNQEYLAQPGPDVLSVLGSTLSSTVSSFVDKLPTFPRSRPATPVKGIIDDNKPDSVERLAPIITDETVYRVRRSNKKTHSKKVEIAPPTEQQLQKEREEAELVRREADAERAAQLAIQKAMDEAKRIEQEKQEESQRREEAEKEAQAKIQEEIASKEKENEAAKAAAKAAEIARQQAEKAKRQEEVERQEREKQVAREAELAQQRAIEAKRQQEIERQERERQAVIEAELTRKREIETRKQEEDARRVKEIQDREAQTKQREQDLQIKSRRLVEAKKEKEGIPQEMGALSNLIQVVQQGYSLATAAFIEQRRRENFWPWQRTAVKSLEPDYVNDNDEGQQKKLDAIIQRGLYSFELFRTFLFFGALFNLRKEKFERHFQDCRKASYVQAQLDLLAKGGVLNKGAFGAFVDESLADAFDNAYEIIKHKSDSIKGYKQRSGELTKEIGELEAELLPARTNVQQSSDGALLRSRSPSIGIRVN